MANNGPLSGIKILDLSSVVLGPMTAQYLGDMGADVIKIEAPEGDITRSIGPRRSEGMGALFLANNRNKRSVVLNLKEPKALEALHAMATQSDVLLHSIRAGAAAKLGISYEAIAAKNKRLIYCHLQGFGQNGPYSAKAAYDDIVQALSGLAMLQKIAAGEPRYIPSIVCDKITAVHAAYAIALALFHRERSGEGQKVEVPMLETIVAFNSAEHLGGYIFDPPVGQMGYEPVRQGMRRPFPTSDGYICFMPYNDANWREFLTVVGRTDMLDDPRFSTQKGRQANLALVWGGAADIIKTRSTAEWEAVLGATDIPHAAVNDLEDLLDDPHLEAVGFWQRYEHPSEGGMRLPGMPLTFSQSTPSIRRLPPRLGEHTAEVMREFGLDDSRLAS